MPPAITIVEYSEGRGTRSAEEVYRITERGQDGKTEQQIEARGSGGFETEHGVHRYVWNLLIGYRSMCVAANAHGAGMRRSPLTALKSSYLYSAPLECD